MKEVTNVYVWRPLWGSRLRWGYLAPWKEIDLSQGADLILKVKGGRPDPDKKIMLKIKSV